MKQWWHKFAGYESFRVVFPDKSGTGKIKYQNARAYQAVFGGTIVFDPDLPEYDGPSPL